MGSNQREQFSFLESAVCIIILALLFANWIFRLTEPFPINYGEGPLLDQAVRLSKFTNIYQPITDAPPWTVSNYPPLYQLLNVPFVWLFGPAFWYGRLLSMLAAFISAWLVQQLAIRLGASRASARFGAVLFLSSYPVLMWSALMRVDSVALLFGLYAIYKSLDRDLGASQKWQIIIALTLTALTRWINLFFPAAVVVLLVSKRLGIKQTLGIFGIVAIAISATFCGLTMFSDGWFLIHTVSANANQWDLWRAIDVAEHAADFSPSCMIVLVATLLALLTRRYRLNLSAYFVLLFSIPTAVAAGKIGSDVNYLFDLCAGIGICCGVLLTKIESVFIRKGFVLAVGLLSISILQQIAVSTYAAFTAPDRKEALVSISSLVKSHSGKIISDDLMGIEVINGYPLLFQPFEMNMLSRQGLWNERSLIEAIDQKLISCAIVTFDTTGRLIRERWPESFQARILDRIHQNYNFDTQALQAYDFSSFNFPIRN